jgi:hypothetical protein
MTRTAGRDQHPHLPAEQPPLVDPQSQVVDVERRVHRILIVAVPVASALDRPFQVLLPKRLQLILRVPDRLPQLLQIPTKMVLDRGLNWEPGRPASGHPNDVCFKLPIPFLRAISMPLLTSKIPGRSILDKWSPLSRFGFGDVPRQSNR